MEKIVNKVEKQELEITYIKKTLDDIANENKKQSEQLSKIGESIQKQEIILEKISNLEDKYQDGSKRVHRRIDDVTNLYNAKFVEMNNKIDACSNRPCVSHNVIENELKHIKDDLNKHSKIFWTAISSILLIVIGAIVKGVLK
jgi:chromosome segregation ATPase